MRPDKHRLTQAEKEADNKQWYKDFLDYYDRTSFLSDYLTIGTGEYYRMRVNYDLYDGKFDPRDLMYVTKPWGEDFDGELPAQLANRDISSTKIRALANMAAKRNLSWKVIAVNPEATTRKEQKEMGMIKDTLMQIMMGEQPEQMPEEIRTYMVRKHQDPVEALGSQLLEYFNYKLELSKQTTRGVKHAAISGKEVYYIGEVKGHLHMEPIIPLYFDHDRHPGLTDIEKGEWCAYEWKMTPNEVIRRFGEELTEEEIDKIYQLRTDEFRLDRSRSFDDGDEGYIRVLHVQWKSLRKSGKLTYVDMEDGEEKEGIVNEYYKLNKELGDISIKWTWVPEVHEGYKIGNDIYIGMGAVQHCNEDADLSYVGTIFDYEGGQVVSAMDRMRPYQYLYNIINYRMELLMAQDKGKKVLFNIGAIPRTHGITLAQFEHSLDANSYGYLNPGEEGSKFGDGQVTNLVKEVDLSNTSDINKYQNLAEWIDMKCGEVVGIPKQLEGQIQEREAVQNVNNVVSLSTNVSGTFFQTHDNTVKRVLETLLNKAKSVYYGKDSDKLTYVLDDMSVHLLSFDTSLMANASFGIFIDDSSKFDDIKNTIQQFGFAAMQNNSISMAYAIRAAKAKSIREAEEALLAGEQEMQEKQQQMEQSKTEQQMQLMQMEEEMNIAKHEREIEKIKLQEALKYERELAKQAILALGFQKEDDVNKNEVPDAVDLMKQQIAAKKLEIEQAKLKAVKGGKQPQQPQQPPQQ